MLAAGEPSGYILELLNVNSAFHAPLRPFVYSQSVRYLGRLGELKLETLTWRSPMCFVGPEEDGTSSGRIIINRIGKLENATPTTVNCLARPSACLEASLAHSRTN